MSIKQDEIDVVKVILNHCENLHDMIPTEELEKLDINHKRLYYLLNKLTWFIEYGVSVYYGWLCQSPLEIRDYYKRVHKVCL